MKKAQTLDGANLDRVRAQLARNTEEVGECLEWQGYREDGTPRITVRANGRSQVMQVRRVQWLLHHGPESIENRLVYASCGNQHCVHPDHLKLLTPQQRGRMMGSRSNTAARSAKIAQKARAKGKLTIENVREIRASDETGVALAARFGVNKSMISAIRSHRAWREFNSPFAGLLMGSHA